MRNPRVILALAASTLFLLACSSKEEPARQVVGAAEANLSAIRDQAAQYAPEQLQVAEANLAAARENITWEKYQDVLDKAPELNQSIVTLKDAVVAKQT
jgi:PBP1b-binding outer membrane lipoprotein LpoB